MPSTTTPTLSEDEIDDILYLARTGDITNLLASLSPLLSSQDAASDRDRFLSGVLQDPDTGNTIAHMSAANNHAPTLKAIQRLSPEISRVENVEGNTPLHYAALNGALECVKILCGDDDDDDVGGGQSSVAQQGVMEKVDVKVRNEAGKTAKDLAEGAGRDEVAGYLAALEEKLDGAGKDDEIELDDGHEVEDGNGIETCDI